MKNLRGLADLGGFLPDLGGSSIRYGASASVGYTILVSNEPRPPTDLRAHRRRLDRNLALAVVVFLVGVGGTAIVLNYGAGAVLGVVCLAAGAAIFGLLWLILTLIERWANR